MIDNILILAAGRGLRMLPLTADKPKPLLEIQSNKVTILDRILSQCTSYLPDISININVGFQAEKVLFHLQESSVSLRPTILFEKQILGPAGTLVQFSKIAKGRTLVIHGDLILSNEGFGEFAKIATTSESQIIVCHSRRRSKARSEVVPTQDQRRMIRIVEFVEGEEHANPNQNIMVSSGIFILDLAKVAGFEPRSEEALSPRLLNFLNHDPLEIHMWNSWRYAVDSLAVLNEAKVRLETEFDL